MSGLTPINGALGTVRAKHLLKRLTFGPTATQITQFAAMDCPSALHALFNNWIAPAPPSTPEGKIWVNTPPSEDEEDGDYEQYFKLWWLGQMYQGKHSLEKLVFFLHTVITTKQSTVGSSRALYFQNALFRTYLLNDFSNTNVNFNRYPQFIKKICVDNAMLKFLDGQLNEIGRPNENFARELMELFSLGKGPTIAPGNYTNFSEMDIKQAAKVLTGWETDPTFATKDPDTLLPIGKPKLSGSVANRHDNTVKTFTSALGSPAPSVTPKTALLTPKGEATAESCQDELNQFIDLIYAKKEAAQHFCRKLYRFFVYYDITPAIESEIIEPLAATFISSGFRIRTVLEQLCQSEHFFEAVANDTDDNKYGAIIKSPLEITLGTLRYFNISLAVTDTAKFYMQLDTLLKAIEQMGLPLLEPYDVAGYEPYHQAPDYNRNWITTPTLANRYNFIRNLLKDDNGWGFWLDTLAWAEKPESGITDAMAITATTANGMDYALDLVTHVVSLLLPLPVLDDEITQARMHYFAEFHLGGLPFAGWKNNWVGRNSDPVKKDDTRSRLNNLLNALMQSPEYQLF
jgi:uncharacterized protein (DUF1800 family)